ncbi:MAG: SCO family protein [Bacillati bacterium ANGP1]|uniref:SCO family protein n=1 Tax=Candidatus Segetimicrobium genomatis TaxID=2569760 RepID=A0A537L3G1_9BACT|nr:MAG: SCO family protein [Terrabacteria group bacterium ANGP1]
MPHRAVRPAIIVHLLWLTIGLMTTPLVAVGIAAAEPPFPVIHKPAPDFVLIDQDGRQIRLTQFRGKLVLLTFFYANCTDVCPLTTAALARVQRADPLRDTPAALRAYAKRYQADRRGWHFLTGDPQAVAAVHRRYSIEVRPLAGGLQDHAVPTFLIDRTGMVLGAYGANPDPADIIQDLTRLH